MKTHALKEVTVFTWIVFVAAMFLSFSGVFFNDLYRDNAFIKAVWRGNDVITLMIAAPLMLLSMRKVQANPHANAKFLFVWMGCLWYMIYNYIFYIYGAAFNVFFLGYVVIIIASSLGLLHGLIAMKQLLNSLMTKPVLQASYKGISLFLLLFGLILGGMWVAIASTFLFSGNVPVAITQTGHPTGVVFATDLIFLVAPLITLSYYLGKKNKWAILFTPIILVKCSLYPFVFIVAGLLAYLETKTYDVLTPLYLLLGLGAAIMLVKLLGRFKNENTSH